MKRLHSISALMLFSAAVFGCAEKVEAPLQTLTNWGEEAAGDNCVSGGLRLQTGIDTDRSGTLEEAEATATQFICNGETGGQGAAHLTQTTAEPAGDNCVRGGYRVDFGVDADGDGSLAESEITASEYLCNPERPTEGNVLIRKNFLDGANAECPGGFVRMDYGFDEDGNTELTDNEVSAHFVTCNQLPRIEALPPQHVESCEEAIVVTATASDMDGSIASYEWTVLSSASELEISGADTNEVTVAAGNHLGGATLRLTVTDDLGISWARNFGVMFLGTGCRLHETFYGIDPTSCTAVDIENLAGDDRGGAIVSSNYVYYNGDGALVRAERDLSGLQSIGPEDVDTLFADSLNGTLYSLWNADLEFTSIAQATEGELSSNRSGGFNQIVPINEETLAPGAAVTLSELVILGTHTVQIDGDDVTRYTYGILVAARDGRLLIGSYNRDLINGNWAYHLIYRVFNMETGALILSRQIDRPGSREARQVWDNKRFSDQETNIAGYAMVATGDGGDRVVFRSVRGEWNEYNVTSDELTIRTPSFVDNCDVSNLNLNSANTVAYFHDEGSCFSSLNTDESLIRCDVLFTDNSDGAIDDSGN